MSVTRSTVVLVAIALALGGAALLLGQRPPDGDEAASQPLFEFEEADVQAMTITLGDPAMEEQTLAFERSDGGWQMLQPQTGPADDGTVVYLLNLLVTEDSSKRLVISPDETADFGFGAPLAKIDVTLSDKETRQLVLGNYDFSNQFVYALVDPGAEPTAESDAPEDAPDDAPEEITVHLVSTNFDTAVNRPIAEWQQAVPTSESSPELPVEPPPPEGPAASEAPAN
ncbi:MAG: hypothetical protein WBA10_18205 [Elainellaceae cyanobacterium]